jgi:hypothetical protein
MSHSFCRHWSQVSVTFAALLVVLTAGAPVLAQTVAADQPGPQPQQQQKQQKGTTRVFGSDAGLVLNFVKPDKAGDFEAVMDKLREALQKSTKPERRQQAAGWKVMKAAEPGANNSVVYVFVIDPAVKGADYTVSTILAEGFPDQVQDLYKRYAGALASGQNVVNLARLPPRLDPSTPGQTAETASSR